jgi:hypothetical protein
MGAFNLDLEEYVNYMINHGNTFDGILANVQELFHLSDYAADEVVWKLWKESGANEKDYEYEAYGPDNYEDDAEALASAGFGTDEDYGGDIETF